MTSAYQKLKLTDAIARNTNDFPAIPSISKDGKKAFLMYQITESSTTNILAEIFKIKNGTLVSKTVLNPDIIQSENPFSGDDGHANNSFTRFCVIDDDQGGPSAGSTGKIRVRIFDQKFNLLASRFDIEFAVGIPQLTFPVVGGNFSDDDRYIELTYMIDSTPNAQRFRLHVLNASDLSDVARVDFNGSTFGAKFIHLRHRTYLTLPIQNGTFQFGFNTAIGATEANLSVYRLKKNYLQFVDSHRSAQIINSIYVGSNMIGASSRRAIRDKSIFVDDSQNQNLNRSGKELQLFSFDGCELELSTSEKINLSTSGPVFAEDKNLVLVNQQLSDGNPSFFNLYRIHDCEMEWIDGPYGAPSYPTFCFSRKWLIAAGTNQDKDVYNINLYRVH
jgi:hypothetical protein